MGVLNFKRKRATKELTRILGGVEPPAFSGLTLRILERLRDPEVSFEDLGESMQWDPALTLKLITTVNSAAFAPRRRIDEVKHAITFLGRSQVESIVLGVAARSAIPNGKMPGIDVGEFWLVAARRAAMARALAEVLHPAKSGEAFTTALLLDFAVPVIAAAFGDRYAPAAQSWGEVTGREFIERERAAIGTDHVRAGTLLAASWGLPQNLTRSIELQHSTEACDRSILPAVRLIAELYKGEDELRAAEWIQFAHSEYGIAPALLAEMLESSHAQAAELGQVFGA